MKAAIANLDWRNDKTASVQGLFSAFVLLGLWASSLVVLCQIRCGAVALPWMAAIVVGRTVLHTGVFIVAHDAAHGLVCPAHRRLNHAIGALSIALYALLPYASFVRKHWQHHRHPGTPNDPDFHDGQHSHPIAWYVKFMRGYLDRRQNLILLVGMTLLFHGARLGLRIPAPTLLLVWVVPMLLSTVQMFYFGTYLTHREPAGGYGDRHCANSSGFPVLLSFLTSYHFGYHWEHHAYLHLPWFRLPAARQLRQEEAHSPG